MNTYHSHGKLLLSGEYYILHGAKGLSIPLNVGQTMEVEKKQDQNNIIHWTVKDTSGHWFLATIGKRKLNVLETDHQELAGKLASILKSARKMNREKFKDSNSYYVTCTIGFNREAGLGSSSTFISNLGYWLKIDAMDLHFKVSRGSGFDVASAQINLPIIYHLYKSKYPVVKTINFKPPFTDHLYFIYRGNKVDSADAVGQFNPDKSELKKIIPVVSEITEKMEVCEDLNEFMNLIKEHEDIVSNALGIDVAKSKFPDFKGEIKSLGAWGGDFMLVATHEDQHYVNDYFQQKELNMIYPYQNLALYF